jgi:hypothetical protein
MLDPFAVARPLARCLRETAPPATGDEGNGALTGDVDPASPAPDAKVNVPAATCAARATARACAVVARGAVVRRMRLQRALSRDGAFRRDQGSCWVAPRRCPTCLRRDIAGLGLSDVAAYALPLA